jgi:tetratricopeptide (TPR) repeat protein
LTYNPTFIALPRKPFYKNVIKNYSDYVFVFFDDAEILYVNKNQLPDIAQKYQFKAIDPYQLGSLRVKQIEENAKEAFLNDLLKYSEIFPNSRVVNRAIAIIYNDNAERDKAILYAEALIKYFPEMPDGYSLKGDCLLGQKFYTKAINYYKKAIKRTAKSKWYDLYQKLWFCYTKAKQHKSAYEALEKIVNPFAPAAGYADLYKLSLSAHKIGKTKEALMLLKFAHFKVPPENFKWKTRIEQLMSSIKVEAVQSSQSIR